VTDLAPPALRPYTGTSVRKHDGDLFVTGRAEYINDIELRGMVHLAVLRSPHAHARIRSVDLTAARAQPGVLLALDGHAAAEHHAPIPHFADPALFGGNTIDCRCLAVEHVFYAGQPVAAVVAERMQDAEAALEAIVVDYEVLEPVLDATEAVDPRAPVIHANWTSNIVATLPFVDGDVEAALQASPHVLRDEIRTGRCSTQPIEPRGYVADWDPRKRSLTFHGACQNPHPLRWMLAQSLGVPEPTVRIVVPKLGGAFGLKMHGHPEEVLVCIASRLLGRPVKWWEERSETLLIGGREQTHRVEVGFDAEGRLLALRDHFRANVGAIVPALGWAMAAVTALAFPAGYVLPAMEVESQIVTTNKGPWNASRGYGKEATTLVMERIMDGIAGRLGLDPAEVRRRNMIPADAFPYRTNTGLNIDSGDYHGALAKVLDLVGYDELRVEQAARGNDPVRLGIGIGFEVTPEAGDTLGSLVGGFDSSTVRMDPSGTVTVLTGVTSPGSGSDTGFTQLVADELGVALDAVEILQGDTAICPYGFGNFSGRSMVVGGGSVVLAARDVRATLVTAAAGLLEIDPDDVEIVGGVVTSAADPAVRSTVAEIAYAVYTQAFALPGRPEPALESTRVYRPDNLSHQVDETGRMQPYPTYSSAVHVSIVEVDTETGVVNIRRHGVVHDCGTMINPRFVEGQMEGAIAMGVGAALMEEQGFDAAGVLTADRFKTYLMPRASDLPMVETVHQVTPSPFTLTGAKGAGEAGVGGALAAVANAVNDALAPLGAVVRDTPLTPPRILRAIGEAGA
jgi:aerobic carbon-monoxide dehydrogenase large subunit